MSYVPDFLLGFVRIHFHYFCRLKFLNLGQFMSSSRCPDEVGDPVVDWAGEVDQIVTLQVVPHLQADVLLGEGGILDINDDSVTILHH